MKILPYFTFENLKTLLMVYLSVFGSVATAHAAAPIPRRIPDNRHDLDTFSTIEKISQHSRLTPATIVPGIPLDVKINPRTGRSMMIPSICNDPAEIEACKKQKDFYNKNVNPVEMQQQADRVNEKRDELAVFGENWYKNFSAEAYMQLYISDISETMLADETVEETMNNRLNNALYVIATKKEILTYAQHMPELGYGNCGDFFRVGMAEMMGVLLNSAADPYYLYKVGFYEANTSKGSTSTDTHAFTIISAEELPTVSIHNDSKAVIDHFSTLNHYQNWWIKDSWNKDLFLPGKETQKLHHLYRGEAYDSVTIECYPLQPDFTDLPEEVVSYLQAENALIDQGLQAVLNEHPIMNGQYPTCPNNPFAKHNPQCAA